MHFIYGKDCRAKKKSLNLVRGFITFVRYPNQIQAMKNAEPPITISFSQHRSFKTLAHHHSIFTLSIIIFRVILIRGEGPAALPLLAGLGAALGDDAADPGRDDHVAADVDHVPVDHHVEPVGPVRHALEI